MYCRTLCYVLGLQFDDPCTGKLLVRLILFEHPPPPSHPSLSPPSFLLYFLPLYFPHFSSSFACSKQASNISSFLPSAWSTRLSVLRLVTHTHIHRYKHTQLTQSLQHTHVVRPQLRWRSSSPSPSPSRSPSRRRCLCGAMRRRAVEFIMPFNDLYATDRLHYGHRVFPLDGSPGASCSSFASIRFVAFR